MKPGTTDSCGCALSAKFMAACARFERDLLRVAVRVGPGSFVGLVGRVALVTFVAAAVGQGRRNFAASVAGQGAVSECAVMRVGSANVPAEIATG